VCAGHGLGIMSIGVSVEKKIKILKHCVECVCIFAVVDIYRLGCWPSQLSLQRQAAAWQGSRTAGMRQRLEGPRVGRGPKGRENKVTSRHGALHRGGLLVNIWRRYEHVFGVLFFLIHRVLLLIFITLCAGDGVNRFYWYR